MTVDAAHTVSAGRNFARNLRPEATAGGPTALFAELVTKLAYSRLRVIPLVAKLKASRDK